MEVYKIIHTQSYEEVPGWHRIEISTRLRNKLTVTPVFLYPFNDSGYNCVGSRLVWIPMKPL